MNPAFSCMLFDVDNTLIDTDSLIMQAIAKVNPRFEQVAAKELRSTSFQSIMRRSSIPGVQTLYRTWYSRLAKTAKLFALDTPVVLSRLRYRSVRLGVVTSSPRWAVTLLLASCGISSYFSHCLITYGTCRRRKPYPDPILNAISRLSCRPDEAMYVGDADCDALASRNAGVCFGLATWGRKVDQRLAAKYHAIRLTEIRDLLNYAP